MSLPLEYKFNSRAINWCRYYPDTKELEVTFTTGGQYRYIEVPREVVDSLIVAPSVGSFFDRHIAYNYRHARHTEIRAAPIQTNGSSSALIERSLSAVASHLPEGWVESIQKLLSGTPILVHVVRRRKSKHGDHVVTKSSGFSIITVNASGNCFRFAITLLHEIAHAHVSHRYPTRMPPHGQEWKSAFRNLLLERAELFPDDLRNLILKYAEDPLYSTDSDSSLSQALRKYDTLDLRPTVSELTLGQMFSLDGKLIMTKHELARKWYRCTTIDGKKFRVSPTARVHTIYTQTPNG
jgi:SprT protein